MTSVRVKICGITRLSDLHIAVEAGADAIGFIVGVPQSPRNLSINEAKTLIQATPVFVETVVVTVLKNLTDLEYICDELNPKTIQIHGLTHQNKEIRNRIPDTHIIRAIRAKSDLDIQSVKETAKLFNAVIIDSYVPGKHGGTGKIHDWNLSKQVRFVIHPTPLILAGGLNSENVNDAIHAVEPYAVDVSSGVEASPRVKDRKKVNKFVKKAKKVEL